VLHQRRLDGVDGGRLEVGGQFHATDLGADAPGNGVDVQLKGVWRGSQCGIAHGRGPHGFCRGFESAGGLHGLVLLQRGIEEARFDPLAYLEIPADQALLGGQVHALLQQADEAGVQARVEIGGEVFLGQVIAQDAFGQLAVVATRSM
jgi:hypothetical protein